MKKNRIFLLVGLCLVSFFVYNLLAKKADKKIDCIIESNKNMNTKMRKFIHNKLWRDKGPVRMENTGSIVHVTILNDEEYNHQLGLKLLEEAAEVHTAITKEDLISEIGDVLEVLDCIIALHGLSRDEISLEQEKKRDERGSLLERKFVTTTESIPGTFLDLYCSKDPNKYVEILD